MLWPKPWGENKREQCISHDLLTRQLPRRKKIDDRLSIISYDSKCTFCSCRKYVSVPNSSSLPSFIMWHNVCRMYLKKDGSHQVQHGHRDFKLSGDTSLGSLKPIPLSKITNPTKKRWFCWKIVGSSVILTGQTSSSKIHNLRGQFDRKGLT